MTPRMANVPALRAVLDWRRSRTEVKLRPVGTRRIQAEVFPGEPALVLW